jgi:CRP-like cAMP-binding protein
MAELHDRGELHEVREEAGELEHFFAGYPPLTYAPGERVVRPWELIGGGIVWVRTGIVRISKPARGGREVVVCHLVSPRHDPILFGTAPRLRRYAAEAVTPVEVRRASRATFLDYLARHPSAYRALAEGRMRQISDLYEQLWAAKLGDATQRVAATLLHLCEQAGEPAGETRAADAADARDEATGEPADEGADEEAGAWVATTKERRQSVVLAYPLTQRTMADLTGLSRETVSAALASLRRKGLVAHVGRTLRIECMAALRAEFDAGG